MAKQSVLSRNKKQKAARALQKGQFNEATRLLIPLSKTDPRDMETWVMLASAYGRQGNMPAVVECCQQALTLEPEHPQINSLLGNAMASLGHLEEAQASYRTALKNRPNDPGILNNLGNTLYLAGNLEEAADKLTQVVRLKPDYADAHNNLGNIFKALDRNHEAIQHFQQAVALNPQLHEAYLNLGNILSDRVGSPQAAEDCFRHAVKLRPDSYDACAGLAAVLRFQGKLDESHKVIREDVLRIRPGSPSALAAVAEILELQGHYDDAFEQARPLIGKDTFNVPAAVVMTRLCRRYDCCNEVFIYAEKLLEEPTLNKSSRQELHFALGKLDDKLGRHDEAFTHFQLGNVLTGVTFDPVAHSHYMDRLLAAYNRELMAVLPRASYHDERPIFVVGMPRSGTSLIEQVLASHPRVYGAGELNDINDLVATLNRESPYPACIEDLTQEKLDQLAHRYLQRLDNFSREALRITDKMPHNFLNLGLIALLFPKARIIHCVRDPRDTCLSLFTQNFGWLHPYATNLRHLGTYYREYQRIMQHWEAVLDIPIMKVLYEEMVTDQEAVSRAMVDFIGLEWDDRCLQFHKSKRFVSTASYDQVRQPIYKKSMARWKNYEEHLGPLIEALGDALTPRK